MASTVEKSYESTNKLIGYMSKVVDLWSLYFQCVALTEHTVTLLQISTASFTPLQQQLQERTLATTGEDSGMIGAVALQHLFQPLSYCAVYCSADYNALPQPNPSLSITVILQVRPRCSRWVKRWFISRKPRRSWILVSRYRTRPLPFFNYSLW